MKKKIALYIIIQVIAILLCVIAIAFLDNTKVNSTHDYCYKYLFIRR